VKQTQTKSIIKMIPVITVDLLDRALIEDCLKQCYISENGIEQEYIEWDTGWEDSQSIKNLSQYLVSMGIPKGKRFLLKLIKEGN
jgi:hypothetical protein